MQYRTSNSVNEITNITETTGPSWVTPAYDPAGNMTTLPQPTDPTNSYTATYDAWNRLVKLVDGANTVQENEYDARRYRTIRKDYVSGNLEETRHFYYTDAWQSVEERLDTSTDPDCQHVWGLRYIDDLILRDRDTTGNGTLDVRHYALQDGNWNITAIIDGNGDVQERYTYSAYGVPSFYGPSFNIQSGSAFQWNSLFAGYLYDPHINVYNVRNRVYLMSLGTWAQRDLVESVAQRNLYVYANSSPFSFIDADGREPEQTGQGNAVKCKIRLCMTEIEGIAGRIGGRHLFLIVDRGDGNNPWGYRCGPSPGGKPKDECKGKRKFGKHGQLICDQAKYDEMFVDWEENQDCEELTVSNADCEKVHACFVQVLNKIEACCVNYIPIPITGRTGCNSNCAVKWMLASCFKSTPVFLRAKKPGIAPGYQVKVPECIKDKPKNGKQEKDCP